MAAVLIDGKALAAKCKAQVAEQSKSFRSRPGLAVILVGDNPASKVYVGGKRRDCEECLPTQARRPCWSWWTP